MATHRREIDVSDEPSDIDGDAPPEVPFEDPKPRTATFSILPELAASKPSPFRYFLDGSRRVFSVADIVLSNQYYPIVAGQIGVAIIERLENGRYRPVLEHCKFENVIAFPDKLGSADYGEIQEKLDDRTNRFKFRALTYKTSKTVPNMMDLAIAKIMSEMHSAEISAVCAMADGGELSDERMMIIDGALQFAQQKFEVRQFRNVIGVAKSFQSNLTIGKGKKRQDIGALTKRLDEGDRTHVFGTKFGKYHLGSWYLKLRPQKYMRSPLQGVVKVEAFAVGTDEEENGLDQARVNTISKALMSERNVTPYGKDARWAVHIYPVFQAEQYIKSRFANPRTLMGAF